MNCRSSQIRRSWEDNAGAWLDAIRTGRIESRRLATDAAMLDAAAALAARRVLDVGCGEGWLCRALGDRGIDAVGIDACSDLVDAARARGGRFHHMEYAALARAPLALGRFDAALCNFALFECELLPLLRALASLLQPDGALLVQTLHPDAGGDEGWREERFTSLGAGFKTPMPWYQRSLTAWLQCLDEAGFTQVQSRDVLHPRRGEPLSLLLTARF